MLVLLAGGICASPSTWQAPSVWSPNWSPPSKSRLNLHCISNQSMGFPIFTIFRYRILIESVSYLCWLPICYTVDAVKWSCICIASSPSTHCVVSSVCFTIAVNPCAGCTHGCNGVHCTCPPGFKLAQDSRTCIGKRPLILLFCHIFMVPCL